MPARNGSGEGDAALSRLRRTGVSELPRHLAATYGIEVAVVEELDLGHGPLGWLHDLVAGKWFARSVDAEVREIGRLLEAGERGRGVVDD